MVRDAIKPNVTMFLHYETIEEKGKGIVVVDIQRGTDRPYYLAKKGMRPEGVYVRKFFCVDNKNRYKCYLEGRGLIK